MRSCPLCQAPNSDVHLFCERCGSRLVPPPMVNPTTINLDEELTSGPEFRPLMADYMLEVSPPDQIGEPAKAREHVEPMLELQSLMGDPIEQDEDTLEDMPAVATLVLSFADGAQFVTNADTIDVGRADPTQGWTPGLDLTLYGGDQLDLGVSRVHARLLRVGDQYRVVDLKSTNGTYVNGRAVTYGEPAALATGNTLEFGALSTHVTVG